MATLFLIVGTIFLTVAWFIRSSNKFFETHGALTSGCIIGVEKKITRSSSRGRSSSIGLGVAFVLWAKLDASIHRFIIGLIKNPTLCRDFAEYSSSTKMAIWTFTGSCVAVLMAMAFV